MDGVRVCRAEWGRSEGEKQVRCAGTYIWNLGKGKGGHEEPSGRTGVKAQTCWRVDLGMWGGRGET